MSHPLAVEQIDLQALPWFPMEHYHALPQCPALYFVLEPDGTVAYIGRTLALKNRLSRHHRLLDYVTRPNMRIAWLFVSDPGLLPDVESACIAFFHPRDNYTLVPPVKRGRKPVRRSPALKVLHVFKRHGLMTLRELGKNTRVPTRAIATIVAKMVQGGIVRAIKSRKTTRYILVGKEGAERQEGE